MEHLAIHTDRLTRKFQYICAVVSVSLNIPRCTIYGLLGPAGSGKSTVVRLLLGLLEPSSGSARVLGLDPTCEGAAVRAQCGVVLQSPSLYSRLSVEQNLDLFGRIWGLKPQERAARSAELLRRFGLWERHDEPAEHHHAAASGDGEHGEGENSDRIVARLGHGAAALQHRAQSKHVRKIGAPEHRECRQRDAADQGGSERDPMSGRQRMKERNHGSIKGKAHVRISSAPT